MRQPVDTPNAPRLTMNPGGNSSSGQRIPPKLDFQGVILAGGLGTRMRPLTETIPKPMIPVSGKPFLHHQLELLRRSGFRRVLLLVAYLGEQIEEHFGDGRSLDLELSYSYEPEPLGTGGALKNAGGKLEREFLVLNGDTFLAIDYTALVANFRQQPAAALIVAQKIGAQENENVTVKSNLALTPDGWVKAYQKRDPAGMTHIDAGAVVLDRQVLEAIPPGKKFSLEEEIFPRLIEQRQMRAWVTLERFIDMGSPEGLRALEARLG